MYTQTAHVTRQRCHHIGQTRVACDHMQSAGELWVPAEHQLLEPHNGDPMSPSLVQRLSFLLHLIWFILVSLCNDASALKHYT